MVTAATTATTMPTMAPVAGPLLAPGAGGTGGGGGGTVMLYTCASQKLYSEDDYKRNELKIERRLRIDFG